MARYNYPRPSNPSGGGNFNPIRPSYPACNCGTPIRCAACPTIALISTRPTQAPTRVVATPPPAAAAPPMNSATATDDESMSVSPGTTLVNVSRSASTAELRSISEEATRHRHRHQTQTKRLSRRAARKRKIIRRSVIAVLALAVASAILGGLYALMAVGWEGQERGSDGDRATGRDGGASEDEGGLLGGLPCHAVFGGRGP